MYDLVILTVSILYLIVCPMYLAANYQVWQINE